MFTSVLPSKGRGVGYWTLLESSSLVSEVDFAKSSAGGGIFAHHLSGIRTHESR